MISVPQDIRKINDSSNSNNIILSTSIQQSHQNNNSSLTQILSQNSNKSNQLISKDICSNKLNMNSSLNMPSTKTVTNVSLNDQILHHKKDNSDYFDNEISYQDEEDNDPIFKEYTMINNRRNKTIDELKNISERIKNNNKKIEEIKNNLIDLKEEKKQKQKEIFNLLSNKESIEEIYKNHIYSLNKYYSSQSNNFKEKETLSNDNNIMIPLKNNQNISILENEILNNDEENFKISLTEIKESDQKKYIEQVINMFEEIFKKREEKLNSLITNIINNAYELFINNISPGNENENNKELIITNFFGKVSLFISNHSLGKYPESKINLFLRYLLKINSLNLKLNKHIKFVNKKYKDKKMELIDMINFLEKKNINLSEKNSRLENNMKEYDDKLEFFGKNDAYEIERKSENSDDDYHDRGKKSKNRNKKEDSEEQLSHDIVIEYEDGIDQNVEINYEEDDMANEYDYEKENEMINQGLNPYKMNEIQNEKKVNATKNIEDKNEKKENIIVKNRSKNRKKENIDYLIIEHDNSNKNFIEINDGIILEKQKENKNKNYRKINNKNTKYKTKENFPLDKKFNYSNNFKTTNTVSNIISDNRILPTPPPDIKIDDDIDNKLTKIELENYNRIQRIMNTGPRINNTLGVNNYNHENSFNGTNELFSSKKNFSNAQTSNSIIDKTIRNGSRQNHNFISIININKNIPIKKKNPKEKNEIKEKSQKNKENDNIINLEENILNEIKDNDKNEVENKNINKTVNESTLNYKNSNNNNIRHKNYFNENYNIENNTKSSTYRVNKNINDRNEVQGYFLNIINSKPSKNEENKKNDHNCENSLKITKIKELNFNDIKTNKMGIITKKIVHKNGAKPKTKLLNLKNNENKDAPFHIQKINNNSLNKKINKEKIINNNINGNNNYSNINNLSIKRSNSTSENIQIKKNKNIQYNNKVDNSNISPINKSLKISNIPFAYNKNYNSFTYEGNYKKENKSEKTYVTNNRK